MDGIHSHPTSIKIAHKAHPSGTILVTDAMAALGLPPGNASSLLSYTYFHSSPLPQSSVFMQYFLL